MKSLKSTVDLGQLNAITDQVLSYTPPSKKGASKKRSQGRTKNPLSPKEGAVSPKLKKS